MVCSVNSERRKERRTRAQARDREIASLRSQLEDLQSGGNSARVSDRTNYYSEENTNQAQHSGQESEARYSPQDYYGDSWSLNNSASVRTEDQRLGNYYGDSWQTPTPNYYSTASSCVSHPAQSLTRQFVGRVSGQRFTLRPASVVSGQRFALKPATQNWHPRWQQ